jgi:murein DD-endopeptidase MepM/ murein hydrolase activator NlpD
VIFSCYTESMNKRKVKILFLVLCVLALSFCGSTAVKGMTDEQVNSEIKDLNDQIKGNKDKMAEIEAKKKEYAQNIAQKQAEADSLKGEMAILDNQIAIAEIDIENLKNQINQAGLEMKKLGIEITAKQDEIEKEKKNIATTLKLIYQEDDASMLEVLLLNNSLSEFLNRVKYLEDVNQGMGESLDNLKKFQAELEGEQADLAQKSDDFKKLKGELERSKLALEDQKQGKIFLLEETKNSEKEYQGLIAQLKEQQDAANSEIADLEKSVRERLESLKKEKLDFNDNGLIWPVPQNYITTYFHDPDYPFRYLFEHPAVDIRASQGSPIKAAASGYVAQVKLNGKAYGYIMLIHGNGISTVYGHISKSFVSSDDYIVQGQTIALSGGLPGTTGSGPLTTGPHLHFEVRKDGIPVNPLEYLP